MSNEKWDAYQAALRRLTSMVDGISRQATPWRDRAITAVTDTSLLARRLESGLLTPDSSIDLLQISIVAYFTGNQRLIFREEMELTVGPRLFEVVFIWLRSALPNKVTAAPCALLTQEGAPFAVGLRCRLRTDGKEHPFPTLTSGTAVVWRGTIVAAIRNDMDDAKRG
jgi:hypothetical protein